MATFKDKVKNILRLQRPKTHEDGELGDIHSLQPPDLPHAREDLRKTEEIISEIDDSYFEEDSIDCGKFELEKLGTKVDVSALEERIFVLKTQDNAVYRKIYDLVFANYTAYVQGMGLVGMTSLVSLNKVQPVLSQIGDYRPLSVIKELENVTMLQMSLREANKTCLTSRRQLKQAREGVSHGGLGLLARHRRRQRIKALLEILKSLKTLQRTDARLKELLEEGNYPAATQLCLECQSAIEMYKQYSCVSDLAVSLQDIQQDIEKELEGALSTVCRQFNVRTYEQVQNAYGILGKTQTAVDTLLMMITSSIHDLTYAVVVKYVKLGGSASSTDGQQFRMPFASLCKLVDSEHFIPCLNEICQTMWKIMYNYHQIKSWHGARDVAQMSSESGSIHKDDADSFSRHYVKTKLENGLLRVWRDVQQKVKPYLLAIDMSSFKYDDFLRVLNIVNQLMLIGHQFCGEGSDSLQESMRIQSLKYFRSFHRSRLDELRIFMETEAWELCPVRSTFTIHQLREFRFLRCLPSSPTASLRPTSPTKIGSKIFEQLSSDDDPFDMEDDDDEGEDIIEYHGGEAEAAVSDDDRNDDDDLSVAKEFAEDSNSKKKLSSSTSVGPLLANTTLTVIRFFGNYIQMMNVLRTIAFDVVECLSQLFDYYLFSVYQFFAVDLLDSTKDDELSTKLTVTLKRISETLISQDPNEVANSGELKVPAPAVNAVVDLNNPNSLYGLRHRIVAVESLVFLAGQFEYLMTYLKKLVPDSKQSFLMQFLSHTVKTSHELRKPVYNGVAAKAISFERVLQSLSHVKWDVKEIKSQHNSYVDLLLQEFNQLSVRLAQVERCVHVPPQAYNMLWECAIVLANRTFVDGFAQAKKCSNEGRALMQLDFQQFRTQIERMSKIKPLPSHGYVEDYIKAYYLSEVDTEDWIKKRREYTPKQLQALVNVGIGARISKRSRQKLLSLIEDK